MQQNCNNDYISKPKKHKHKTQQKSDIFEKLNNIELVIIPIKIISGKLPLGGT